MIQFCCKLMVAAVFSVSVISGYCYDKQSDTILYQEKYRPRYHFTPAHRWIGDPCGLVKHGGKYHAYSWGAAETEDLVRWTEINDLALTGLPENISPFTGSVVVDKDNTGGWGKDALVAVFTSFDNDTKKQSQSVAFSHDGGKTYSYYDQNPVLDIWSTEFRDPAVIRYGDKWIMAVARALEKKVAFYASADLKHWTWLSDFGPMGDNEKSWECPNLFQLDVEGSGEKKWVLAVSVNWAREQYFIGEFDGTKFIADHPCSIPLYVDHGLDYYASNVFADYDDPSGDVYTIGWINTWDYAQQAPSEWGKGIWSLPRKLTLYKTGDGLRLRQLPAKSLEKLREEPVYITKRLPAGVLGLNPLTAMDNQYELDVQLKPSKNDVTGLNLCCGYGRKVSVMFDAASGYLTIDRLNSTDADIPKFSRTATVKVSGANEKINLDVFVDETTIEIFVNGGEQVLTMLTYAAPEYTGVEAFSLRGGTEIALTAWPMKSIW